jgi:hypothetical protein
LGNPNIGARSIALLAFVSRQFLQLTTDHGLIAIQMSKNNRRQPTFLRMVSTLLPVRNVGVREF